MEPLKVYFNPDTSVYELTHTISGYQSSRNIFNLSIKYVHMHCSYDGHVSSSYKLDSCVSHTDAYIVSGSEDGKICFWDLVEVSSFLLQLHICQEIFYLDKKEACI